MGIAYLEQRYHQLDRAELWQMNESAFTLFVLTELGNGNPGQMSVLYDNRAGLGLYGKAYLAMAMDKMGNGDESFATAVDTLIQELLDAAQYDQDRVTWREKQQDYRNMNTDVRTSAIILTTLLRLRPADPILPQAVRGLMAARQFGYWNNTQETAWSIIALTDWLVATGELEGNYTWEVKLNDQALGSGVMNAESLSERVELRGALLSFLQNETHRLEIERGNQSGQLYYSTQLRYAVDALAVQPINQGIAVDRRFEIDTHAVNTATVGDLITMTVRISTSRELHHALIEMPIPAGSEPIDQRLSTEAGNLGNDVRQRQTWADEGGFPVEYSRLWPTYVDIRDDKIALFATNLPPGQYFVTFPIRATLPGLYRVLPVHAEMMYFTAIMGRSAGDQFEIEEAKKR